MRYFLPALAFFVLVGNAFALVAECPTWQVGDEWAWGERYDLKEMVAPIFQELAKAGSIKDWSCDGKAEGYTVMRVDAVEEGGYRASVRGALELKLKLSVSLPEALGLWTPWLEASMHGMIRMDGTLLQTTQLALKEQQIALTGDFSFTVEGAGTKVTLSVKDFTFLVSIRADEPLDVFNFPIEVGESWTFGSHLHETVSLRWPIEVSLRFFEYENSFSEEIREEYSADEVYEGWGTCTRVVEMEVDGIKDNCFEIKVGPKIPGSEAFPILLYYSPRRKNVVAFSLDWTDILSSFQPALEKIETETPEMPLAFSEYLQVLSETLQSMEVEGTLVITSLSPQEAYRRMEAMGRAEIPWVLLGVPIVIVVCVLLVRKFYW